MLYDELCNACLKTNKKICKKRVCLLYSLCLLLPSYASEASFSMPVMRLVVLVGFSGCFLSDLWWLGGCGVYVDGLFIVCKLFVNGLLFVNRCS